ncbi:hypothetical protein [Alteromonas gracilis]|uniref:hypothetical protein n=1 Tax=Alteromonas gracilis TaxID=1479524 RepID=UPI0037359D8F
MNTKTYINRFPEIATLSEVKQEAILEQARYVAFTQLGLSGQGALFFLSSLITGLLFPLVTFTVFHLSLIANTLAIGAGCIVTVIMYQKLYASLLRQGLNKVLSADNTSQQEKP